MRIKRASDGREISEVEAYNRCSINFCGMNDYLLLVLPTVPEHGQRDTEAQSLNKHSLGMHSIVLDRQ